MKFKYTIAVLFISVFTLFGGHNPPPVITVINVAHANGYALSPNGDFEYYEYIPNPPQTGLYDLQNSADQGAHWYFVQERRFYGGDPLTVVWFLPNPAYPDLWYRYLRIGK